MKGNTLIIRVDGTTERQEWTTMPPLSFYQKAVGGYIEAIPYWPVGIAFCNEEGKIKGLKMNAHAQMVWCNRNDVLVGDIVQVTGDAEFMAEM